MKGRNCYLEKYKNSGDTRQLILTEYEGDCRATLELWTKGADGAWQLKLKTGAFTGKAGVGRAAENDSKTPLGDFGLGCAFGIKPDPGSLLPYIPVDEHIYCCGDREHYNRIVDIRDYPHQCSGEHMADFAPEYNYGIFFDYNKEGIPGLGFAIFLHCKGEKNYTGGCIAIEEEAMKLILQNVDSGARICIFETEE